MAQVYSIDGVAVNNRIRTTADPSGVEGLPSSAWYGEAMIAGVTIDDPLGELDLMGWHTFTHDETDCTGSERTFTGWITGKDISRGTGRQATGAARVWDCEIIDQNAVWKLKLFRAASAQRPAESDIERMDFMRTSAPMAATPVADNGRWNVTDNPTNFGAASYVAQYPIDLANSVAGISGKNFYAYWDDTAGEISGHYDLVGANPLSTITISNVIADHSSTCVYPLLDAVLTRSPEDQVNGVLFQYLGDSYVYVQDADLFGPGEFSPVNFDRDVLYSTDRVGRLETANALAASQLAARSTEQDTLTVTVMLTPAQVNLLHAGMKVSAKFSHLPGYEDFVDLAVIRRNAIPPVVVGGDYTVRLELSNMVAGTGPGGGDPGTFPPPPPEACEPGDLAVVNSGYNNVPSATQDVTIPFTPTVGNTVVLDFGMRYPGSVSVPGWTDLTGSNRFSQTHQNYAVQRFMKVWGETDVNPVPASLTLLPGGSGDDVLLRCATTELLGTPTPIATDTTSTDINYCAPPTLCGDVTIDSGVDVLLLGMFSVGWNVSTTGRTWTPNDGETELVEVQGTSRVPMWVGYRVDTGTGAALSMSAQIDTCPSWDANGYGGILTAFICPASDPDVPCISPGQPSPEDEAAIPAVGDGTTTTFETRCQFADSTLHVKVDNLNQDGAVTAYDGEAKTFTLGFAPLAGEQVTVNYLGR